MILPKMSGRSTGDWLPSGWSVSVRVRTNGKKDKVVLRFLDPSYHLGFAILLFLLELRFASCDSRFIIDF